VLGRIATYARCQQAFVAAHPERCLTVRYKDCVADPMSAVRRIYAHADRRLSPEAEAAMAAHVAENTQHRHGKPDYSLDNLASQPPPSASSLPTTSPSMRSASGVGVRWIVCRENCQHRPRS
jgi:hypothetical protein